MVNQSGCVVHSSILAQRGSLVIVERNLTFGVAGVIFTLCLISFSQQGSKGMRADRNSGLAIQVSASRYLVKLPPTPDLVPLDCEPTENKVKLYANSTSSHNAKIKFSWQVPVGRLIEKGREVTWDLSRVQAGTYTATVKASDKHKHTANGSITVTVVVCPGWRPDPPPCPLVSVTCPAEVDSKGTLTFVANVTGGDAGVTPTYKWTVSAGKITGGQGTAKVTVDVSGLSRESVTATVAVGGMNPLCHTVASCTTNQQ